MKVSLMARLNKRGSVIIIVALAMVGLIGSTALVVDIGAAYAEKAHIAKTLDAAAIAGAMELPHDTGAARDKALEYIGLNNLNPANADVIFADGNTSIEVRSTETVNHFFAPVLNIDSSVVSGVSKAVVGNDVFGVEGLRPFGIEVGEEFEFGDSLTLFEGPGEGYKGNFKRVAFVEDPSDYNQQDTKSWMAIGNPEKVMIDDQIISDTGANLNPFVSSLKTMFNNTPGTISIVVPVITPYGSGVSDLIILGFVKVNLTWDGVSNKDSFAYTLDNAEFAGYLTADDAGSTSLSEKLYYQPKLVKP